MRFLVFANKKSGRQDFSPLAVLGLKIQVGEGFYKSRCLLRKLAVVFVCCSPASKLSLSPTKKPPTFVSGFCSRGGRIRTCDLLVPNQAP